jgi:phosphonate transport system permease protein
VNARRGLFLWGLALVVCAWMLEWRLPAFGDPVQRARAFERLGDFLSAFGAPDLSRATLARTAWLAAQTLSIALLGTLLGAIGGWGLGAAASRAVRLDGGARRGAPLARALLEGARLVLDVLRGVPDFAWALLILTGPGPGPVTGVLAVGLSTTGILGKIFSELWDNLTPGRGERVRAVGGGRVATLFYGLQPAAGRAMLSYALMRLECAVRNATVIGVVGGGGLGAELFDELNYGNHDKVVTLLGALLVLTASTDLFSDFLRRQLQDDANHPRAARALDLASARRRRVVALGAFGGLCAAAILFLRPAWQRAALELERIEWSWIGAQLGQLASLDLSARTLRDVVVEARVPLALGLLSTALGTLVAAALAWPSSRTFQLEAERFSGERTGPAQRALRTLELVAGRATALVLRAVPEVAWLLVLASFFTIGTLPGVLAMGLHSGGVLARVFVERLDAVPHRRLESGAVGGRRGAFLYGALPDSARDWATYALFQLEINVRMGVVFGILGLGGLGDRFHSSLSRWNLPRAGTFLLAMVLLTVLIDRLARARGGRTRLAE